MSSSKPPKPSTVQRENLSAWIDGEQSFNESEFLQLLEDELLRDDLDKFQLISDCLKTRIDKADTVTPLPPPAVRYSQLLARAALWVLVPGILLALWLKDGGLGSNYNAVGTGGTLVAVKPEQRQQQTQDDLGMAALTAANRMDNGTEDADFRMDYIIYHSAYLSSNKNYSAVLPYVRLASYPRVR